MKTNRLILHCMLTSAAAYLATDVAVAQTPLLSSKDKIQNRPAELRGASAFTLDKGGHSGKAGDTGLDFKTTGGPAYVQDASFVNALAQNDEMAVSIWVKKYDIVDGSGFWFNSPSSSGATRGFQAHIPWSNDNIYFDDAGCCDPPQRISAPISGFAGYTGDDSWWTNWHLFVFSKKGVNKEIWIDGQFFLDQSSQGVDAAPLPTDFKDLYLGADGTGSGGLFHAIIDDFCIYGTALSSNSIYQLYNGTLPSGLPASDKLTAWWDFNDPPSEGAFTSVLPAPNTIAGGPNLVQVVHTDGSTPWDATNVSLKIDGADVATTFVRNGINATVSYVPSPIFGAQTTHKASLTYPGAAGPTVLNWTFTVGLYTKDIVGSHVGAFTGGSAFTADRGGRTGQAGDRAADFGKGTGPVDVSDGTFLNALAANDEMSVSFWLKKPGIESASAFWFNSTSSNNGQRGYQAHVPWSNDNIYFDTAGCCDPPQRISAGISTFSGYTGDDSWWTNWHHFVFSKKGVNKQIYIDGQLFLDQSSAGVDAAPLKTDFTEIFIGATAPGNNLISGQIDDFAIFGTSLSQASVQQLSGGALPTALPSTDKLTAYWDFNQLPASGLFTSIVPALGSQNARPDIIRLVHLDGSTAWDASKVTLKVNDTPVTVNFAKNGSEATVLYNQTPLFVAGSTNKAMLSFPGVGANPDNLEWTFVVQNYKTLDASLSTPAGSVDTTKPGLTLHVAQIDFAGAGDSGDYIANQADCANAMIAGTWFPWYGANGADVSGAVASNMWYWTGPVDFNDVTSPGSFTFDAATPGIPGSSGNKESFASDFQTWIVFPSAGYYQMGVNSDDSFRVSEGLKPDRQVLHVTGNGINKDVGAVVSTTIDGNGGFGAPLPTTPIVAPVVYLDGSVCPPNLPNLAGKIAVSLRRICNYSDAELAYQLQKAGAVAAIAINTPTSGFPYTMTGSASGQITIPTLCVSGFAGELDFWATNANLTASIGASEAIKLGAADYGKGMSWVDFGFVVPQAGAYPFHLIYEQGQGGAGLEWCQIQPDGTRICVNDTNSASALKLYREATVVARPTMSIAKDGGVWKITYTGTLQSSTSVDSGYSDVTGATSPYTVDTSSAKKFYRARN